MPEQRTALLRTLIALLMLFLRPDSAHSQPTPATLTGVVLDPSGAAIPNATVLLHSAELSTADRTTATSRTGRYTFAVALGAYTVTVTSPSFAPSLANPVQVETPAIRTLDVQLKIRTEIEQIDVPDQSTSADPANNGDSITLRGRALDALPLDQNQMLRQLQALAGSNAPDIFIDGFSGGTLPPRDTIREVRINQNPYSAQNDTNPVNGRIEVFTKPGSEHFHGDLYAFGNDSALNSLNPFVTAEPPYYSANFFDTLSGPLTRHSSFFVNGGHRINQAESVVDAQIVDANLNQVNLVQAVSTPSTSNNFSARIDAALGTKSTVIFRYALEQSHDSAAGIGQFALASQAYASDNANQTFQLSNTQILSSRIVDDTRFQYVRSRVRQTPASFAPTILVQGAFTGGGSNAGAYNDNQDRFEFQNYTSAALGKHFLNFGLRLRDTRDANRSLANYNGEFIFSSLAVPPGSGATPLSSVNSYERTLQNMQDCASRLSTCLKPSALRAAGGGASQFIITAGNPGIAINVFDAGLFIQDDWKARANLTLSGGLRFETQTAIHDHADFGPRFGLVYSFGAHGGKKPARNPYTLRAGAGIFYRRFSSGYVLQAARQNGVNQQQYIVNDPDFYPDIPAVAALSAAFTTSSTVFQISPNFRAPRFLSSTLALERTLGNYGTVTATYYNNRGVHTQLTRNINAPLPGTYNPAVPTSGLRPLAGKQNIYQYDSAGIYRDTRLSLNFNAHYKSRLYLYGFYEYRRAYTDDNAGGFTSDTYNLRADYGRLPDSPAHQFNAGSGFDLPFGFYSYLFVRAATGLPFNIVLPQDLNGDSQFNDRPTFATDLTRPSVVSTTYGVFDTAPLPSQTAIPYDYGTGPGLLTVFTQVSRDFHFGPELPAATGSGPAPGQKPHIERRYTLNIAMTADNVLNHTNYATPVGTLNSPLFGRSTGLAPGFSSSANRIIGFQTYLHF